MINAIKTRIETALFEETVQFYIEIIGLRKVVDFGEEKGAILAVTNKRSEGFLEIAYSATPRTASEVSLQFRTPNINRFVKRVYGKVVYKGPKLRPWGSKYVYMADPNGVQVIVYEGDV